MSGSISSSVALSLLSGLTSSNGTPDLASILYGQGGPSGGDPVAALLQAEKNEKKQVTLQQKDPQTKAEIAHFNAVVAKATDLKTVLADPIAQKVFLTANGLASQVGYTALVTKALLSDPTDKKSLAAKLNKPAYNSAITTYNFFKNGLSTLKQPNVLSTIATEYAQVTWETAQDQTTPGLSAALDFRNRAATAKKADDILGDANLRKVVTGALGIPLQIAFQPITTQEKAITDHLDITKLQDPKFVENLARQFLINNQAATANTTAAGGSITSLFA